MWPAVKDFIFKYGAQILQSKRNYNELSTKSYTEVTNQVL